jgi:hypothetical protein
MLRHPEFLSEAVIWAGDRETTSIFTRYVKTSYCSANIAKAIAGLIVTHKTSNMQR